VSREPLFLSKLLLVSLIALSPGVASAAEAAAALRAQAQEAYAKKRFAACGDLYDQAAKVAAWPTELDGYNGACCRALAGQPDLAFAALERSVAAGLRSTVDLEHDDDLKSLRALPRWKPLVERIKAKEAAWVASINRELYTLFTADQADRAGNLDKIDWKVVAPRDEQRRVRTLAIVKAGQARVAADYYHAAMVMQHGATVEDTMQARAWALRAVELDGKDQHARWLAAAAEDRILRRQGKPQKWGTQYEVENGKWVVAPVDPKTTDAERAQWNVPSLAEARARAASMAPPPPVAK
jgi:hypothetical protein